MYGKGNRLGVFFTPMAGKIYLIKLVHISGEVGCASHSKSKWGCANPTSIHTIITDKENNVVFPEDRVADSYSLPGFTSNSPELVLTLATPLVVTAGQEYRVWFKEDLINKYENNNVGPSCMKVLLKF